MTGIPLLRKNRLTKTIETMKKLLLLLFAAALSLSASEPARAWGREGHETIAKIAERNLTKRAKKRIEKYLGGHSVVYYAKWMDEYRQTPEYAFTNDWHTAPVGADLRYGDELLKPGKGNAVYGLELAIRNLRDYRSLTDSAVAVNLKYVIHLVGDMHCPAHIKYTTHNTKYDVSGTTRSSPRPVSGPSPSGPASWTAHRSGRRPPCRPARRATGCTTAP